MNVLWAIASEKLWHSVAWAVRLGMHPEFSLKQMKPYILTKHIHGKLFNSSWISPTHPQM